MKISSLTDVGVKREMNQDYLYSSEEQIGNLPNLFVVADGMGGHNAGDFASRHAIEEIVRIVRATDKKATAAILIEAIQAANSMIRNHAQANPQMKGMGTTVVAAVIEKDLLTVANVGDSRLYVVGDTIRQISKDHSLVQEMVRMGEMKPENARNHPDKNIITRAVGVDAQVDVDIFEEYLSENDKIILCSDGLTNMVEDEAIQEILMTDLTPDAKTERLIELANENGGSDNITVIIIEPELNEVTRC